MNGECISCGFSIPDEDRLSAPYNLDPEDDRPNTFEPAPEKYEIPSVDSGTAERYGAAPVKERERQNIPNIQVVPTQQNNNQGWQNPYGNSPVQQNSPQNTPQNNPQQGWQNPYNYNPAQRPAPNNANPTVHNNKSGGKYILLMVVLWFMGFISPIFAVIGIASTSDSSMKNNLSTTVRAAFKALFILDLIIYFFTRFR